MHTASPSRPHLPRQQDGCAERNRVAASSRIIGESPVLKRQLALLDEFAAADAPVYVYGETGTGKELVARTLHAHSRRAAKRFIAQNCVAIPDTLLQSLLFGHRRGTFTGADRDQMGLFEAANGGTLLLDEVADMSPTVQGALLRVFQEKEITRLGETHPRRVDVRIISATNIDLEAHVEAERFRRDLYFRLVTLRIDLPTLRERPSDVPLLVDHFITAYNARTGKGIVGIESAALAMLERSSWPGNVRQLEAEIERACILTQAGTCIATSALSSQHRTEHGFEPSIGPEGITGLRGQRLPDVLGDVERSLLVQALRQARGNKSEAARLLGISRQRLSQRLIRLQVNTRSLGTPT
jgi:transcriptional regulator with PAS, ATPase and Fis domain